MAFFYFLSLIRFLHRSRLKPSNVLWFECNWPLLLLPSNQIQSKSWGLLGGKDTGASWKRRCHRIPALIFQQNVSWLATGKSKTSENRSLGAPLFFFKKKKEKKYFIFGRRRVLLAANRSVRWFPVASALLLFLLLRQDELSRGLPLLPPHFLVQFDFDIFSLSGDSISTFGRQRCRYWINQVLENKSFSRRMAAGLK